MGKVKFLVLGKNGQLGVEFLKYFNNKNIDHVALSRNECDVTDLEQLIQLFEVYKPDVVINCTAYNLVDNAEQDYFSAYKVNSCAVQNLAALSKIYKSYFITYSTDYVFDGTKENGLYTEEDIPNPINEYGKSKLTGEKWVLEEDLDKFLIFRVSWVYGEGKQNFIYKLQSWAKKSEYLKIAINEFSVPTPTPFIVDKTLKALNNGLTGLYHLVPNGYASRYEWAKLILKELGIKKTIIPVNKEIFNLPAKRPTFSALDSRKIQKELGEKFEEWDEVFVKFKVLGIRF